MTQWLSKPNPDVRLTPIEGLRFYADALRGDWGSIDGRSERLGLNEYITWAAGVDASTTSEVDVFAELRRCLDVYVIEEAELPDWHDRRGSWGIHVQDLIDAENTATA